jgi:hypothetical protein
MTIPSCRSRAIAEEGERWARTCLNKVNSAGQLENHRRATGGVWLPILVLTSLGRIVPVSGLPRRSPVMKHDNQ